MTSGVLANVDRRTRLAGHNRLELLLFHMGGQQRFGINVFKVQEVIQCPPLTQVPHAHPHVKGIANMRGKTISVIDLAGAVGGRPLRELDDAYVIISEYNRTTLGFLVSGVDRIINMNWEEILPPPKGAGRASYLTAVTKVDGQLVEVIDVERVLADVVGQTEDLDEELRSHQDEPACRHVLVADDSVVARGQIKRTLEQIGYECTLVRDGREALETLRGWADEATSIHERLSLVVSDIEMPEMDGYTLTTELRKDDRLKDLYILLHTSLSGRFNQSMVEQVGADRFIAKFNADELARAIINREQEPQIQAATA